MRKLSIAIAVLGALAWAGPAGVAWGQFAAPSIVPSSFTADNPAVVKWGSPSAIGLGGGTQKFTTDPKTQDVNYTEGNAGLRLVGETLALGLAAQHVADTTAGISDTIDYGAVDIGLQTGNSLAWGLGYNSAKEVQNHTTIQFSQPTFGISIRLAELWFIGAVGGQETVKFTDTTGLFTNFQVQRNTFGGGVGFRRGGTVNVHMEVFGLSKAKSDTDNGAFAPAETTTGGTVEFTFWSFLIGASTRHTDIKSGGQFTSTDVTTADIGYAPRQGLAITLHGEMDKDKLDPASRPPNFNDTTLGTVQITYQF
jgi:hypothetical protein